MPRLQAVVHVCDLATAVIFPSLPLRVSQNGGFVNKLRGKNRAKVV